MLRPDQSVADEAYAYPIVRAEYGYRCGSRGREDLPSCNRHNSYSAFSEKPADQGFINGTAGQSTDQGRYQRHKKVIRPSVKSVVPEAREDGKQSRSEVARGIDGVTMHPPKDMPISDHHQANKKGREMGGGAMLFSSDKAKISSTNRAVPIDLVKEAGHRDRGKGREGRKDTGGPREIGIGTQECGSIVQISQSSAQNPPSICAEQYGPTLCQGNPRKAASANVTAGLR